MKMKKKFRVKFNKSVDIGQMSDRIGANLIRENEDDMSGVMQMDEEEYDEEEIMEMEEVESVDELDEEEYDEYRYDESKRFRMPSVRKFIKEAAEEEGEQFGDEISHINKFLKDKHPDHDEFDWDGNTLKVTFKGDKADASFSRADLGKEIDGFPSSSVQESIKKKHFSKARMIR